MSVEDGGVAVAGVPIGSSSFSPNIVNEGPVGSSFLENTMPINLNRFNPVGEIIFNPFKGDFPEGEVEPGLEIPNLEPLFLAEVMAEAEAIVSKTQANPLTEQSAISEVNNWLGIVDPPVESEQTLPVEVKPLTVAQQAWEASPITRAEEVVANIVNPINRPAIDYLTQPALEPSPILEPVLKTKTATREQAANNVQIGLDPTIQSGQAEQIIEEVLVEEEIKKDQKPKNQEEEIELRIKHVEDEEVSYERKREIRQALGKASLEAQSLGLKSFLGWMVAKFLPPENENNRSQIVKKTGPDGSYQETVEAISASGEFNSEEEAIAVFDQIVAEKKPVKKANDGNQVTRFDIARVLKYLALQVQTLPEVVEKRVVKKTVAQPVIQNKETKKETSLADFPSLAEVFQKAA